MVFRVAFKVAVLMVKRPVWWDFLGIKEDGKSSGFPSVDLVLRHLGRKSKSISSRDSYCYVIWSLCSKLKMNPEELVLRARENPSGVADSVQRIADERNNAGSVRYANNIIHIMKTFFKVNKVELDFHGYFQSARSRRRREYIPSLQEALKMADVAGSLRDRLIILLLIYTGLRNSTLRALVYNEAYPDPFLNEYTVKREMERNEECLVVLVHEVMKQRVPNACKNRIFYYTFIPPKVTDCLRLYLRELGEKFGPITDDQPIFFTQNRRIPLSQRLKTPVSTRELEEIVKKLAKRAGIKNWKDVHPHCLRKTNEGFLRNQPDEVRLDNKEREFFFGHKLPGSQDPYFDKMKIEEMRAKYAKMLFEPMASLQREERVVSEDELPGFLKDGWHFEATLPSGRAVVSRKVRKPEIVDIQNHTGASSTTLDKEKVQTKPQLLEPAESTAFSQQADPETKIEQSKVFLTEKEKEFEKKLDLPKAQDQSSPKNSPPLTGNSETKETKNLPKSTRFGQTDLTDFTAGKT